MNADDRLLAYEANTILEEAGWADPSPDLGYDLASEPTDEIRHRYRERVTDVLSAVRD